jgi:hypothetical protein
MKSLIDGWKLQHVSTYSEVNESSTDLPPPRFPASSNQNSFNIGSSLPVDPSKRFSKRRTSGKIEFNKHSSSGVYSKSSAASKEIANARALPMVATTSRPVVSNNPSRAHSFHSMNSDTSLPVESNSLDQDAGVSSVVSVNSLGLIDYLLKTQNIESSSTRMNVGKGIIAYEKSSEVGLIIRANQKFNIPHDIWCLFYLEDAIQHFLEQVHQSTNQEHNSNNNNNNLNSPPSSLQLSFGSFLMYLLPQTKLLFQYLQHEQAFQQLTMRQQQQTQVHHHHSQNTLLSYPISSTQSSKTLLFFLPYCSNPVFFSLSQASH